MRQQVIETDPQKTQILSERLADAEVTTTNIFKKIDNKVENFGIKLESIKGIN